MARDQINVRIDPEHKTQIDDLVVEWNSVREPGEQKLTLTSFVLVAISRERARRRAKLERLRATHPHLFPMKPDVASKKNP